MSEYLLKKGDDSVNICRLKSYSVETYYTDWIRNTDVALSTNRNVGVSNFKIGLNQSFVTCSFWRLKHIPVHTGLNSRIGTVFNLTQPYYLLVAYGKTNSLCKARINKIEHYLDVFD